MHFLTSLKVSFESGTSGHPAWMSSQLALNEIHIDLDARRHAVDDATDSRSMTLAERGETEKGSY